MEKDTTNNKWKLGYSIPGAGTKTITFPTKDKYVDENIEVTLTTADGALDAGTGSVQGSSTATGLLGTGQSSAPSSGAYIKVEGSASVGVDTAGWVETSDSTTVSIDDVYYPVNEATFTIDGNAFKSVSAGYVAASQTLQTMGTGAQTITGGGLSTTASSTALASNGLSDGSSIDTSKKITLSTSDADGYYELETSGSATVARAAVTKQVTTAGYFAADASATEADVFNIMVNAYNGDLATLSDTEKATQSLTALMNDYSAYTKGIKTGASADYIKGFEKTGDYSVRITLTEVN